MSNSMNKKGSAIITAVGMGVVLLIIIIGVFSFTRYRTQTVIQESRNVKAFALAEAGLEVALGQLFNNSSFETHGVNIEDKELKWDEGNPKDCENRLGKNDDCFYEPLASKGTVYGKLGDGEYKVRVGNILCEDNPNTETIDEKKAYIKIESMGKFGNTIRKIEAIVNRRFPAREFLMYDGDVLSLIYGQTGNSDPNGVNVFSTGHLYGQKKVEISQIRMSEHSEASAGTTQQLDNINAILCGEGGIFFYSDIKAKFKSKSGEIEEITIQPNASFPSGSSGYTSAEAEEFGEFPESLREKIPPISEELKPWIKDGNDWDKGITMQEPDFAKYKKRAEEGGFNSIGNDFSFKYRVHKGWKDGVSGGGNDSVDVVYLDFGNNIREGNVTKDNFPSNGCFYSDKDIVIKGNPPKDCCIVSEKNVFIAGDFNQAGNKDEPKERYGFPQIYKSGESALKSRNYCDESQNLFREDINAPEGKKHHVAATVIAKERIVYDHRSPVDCFENELFPYLKYELAKAISVTDVTSDAEKIFSSSEATSFSVTATSTAEGFKACIATFTEKFKIADAEGLANSLSEVYEGCSEGKFDDNKLEELTHKAWVAYVNDYENNGDSSLKGQPRTTDVDEQGVYKLLFELRKKMCGDQDGSSNITKQNDYLCYPEMTTNGMFISCGKNINTNYAGPSVTKYYDEIGYAQMTSSYIGKWYHTTAGFVHKTFGSETNLRKYDNVKHPKDTGNNYHPPTRHKIYDDTLPFLNDYGNNGLELTGFVVLSWQDYVATPEEFEAF